MLSDGIARRTRVESMPVKVWPDPPRFGDLCVDQAAIHGIVVGVEGDSATGLAIVVRLANGETVERPADEFKPRRLPGENRICNFAELIIRPA